MHTLPSFTTWASDIHLPYIDQAHQVGSVRELRVQDVIGDVSGVHGCSNFINPAENCSGGNERLDGELNL